MAAESRYVAYFKQFGGFTLDVKLLQIVNFSSTIVVGLSGVIQPLFLSLLGYDPATIGIILGASASTSVLFLFPAGLIADRYSRKWVLVLSLTVYALGYALYATRTDFPSLILGSALVGVSWGTYMGPSNAILSDKTTPNERNYAFSLFGFLGATAIIVGSLLAGATEPIANFLHQNTLDSYRTMFWISVAFTAVCVPILLRIQEPTRTIQPEHHSHTRYLKPIGVLTMVNGMFGFGAGAFIPLLPLYLSAKFSATEAQIGALLAASNAAMALTNLFAPKLTEKKGQVAMITITQSLSIIPLALIPMTSSFLFMELAYILRTGLMNMSSPIWTSYTMGLVPKTERASVSGITAMAWNGANAAGVAISGILMETYLDLPFHVGALFYAVSTILFWTYFRKRQTIEME